MPHGTATITGEQREAIYEFLVEQLSRLTDVPQAVKSEDFDTAKRLAREFSQYFRLLDGLGWGADGRLEVALTLPPEELVDALRRIYIDAEGALGGVSRRTEGPRSRGGLPAARPARLRHRLESVGRAPGQRRGVGMKAEAKRLRPGGLDALVLAYLKKHRGEGPLTASAIGKGIGRSSGAIANCLARLAKAKKVRQARRKPRSYVVKEVE